MRGKVHCFGLETRIRLTRLVRHISSRTLKPKNSGSRRSLCC